MTDFICPECEGDVTAQEKYCPGCGYALGGERATEFAKVLGAEQTSVYEELQETRSKNRGALLLSIITSLLGVFALFNGERAGLPFLIGGILVFVCIKIGSCCFDRQ